MLSWRKTTLGSCYVAAYYEVAEVDPLLCLRCGAEIRLVAFIDDSEVIEKILRHLDLYVA